MAAATTLTPLLKSYKIFLIVSVIFGLGEGGIYSIIDSHIKFAQVISLPE